MLICMAPPALSAMDWNALYKHLAALRTELETIRQSSPVDALRFRAVRLQISECIAEITRYHQRAAEDQGAPPQKAATETSTTPQRRSRQRK